MTTIPVLGIPVLNRPDLIRKCIDSIDHPVGTIAVINNSKDIGMTNMLKRICRKHRNVRVINNPKNAGVGGSWNQIFRTFSAPWWFIVGSDIRFERGSIAKIVREVEVHPESVLYFANGFSAFVITSRCLDIIGTFDENRVLNYLNKFKETIISANLLPGFPVVVVGINQSEDTQAPEKLKEIFIAASVKDVIRLVLVVDSTVDIYDWFSVAWQILANTDPGRDLIFLPDNIILIDGTIKAFSRRGFPRKWPNVVCSCEDTVKAVDMKWDSLGLGPMIPSPSLKSLRLIHGGGAEVNSSEG